MSGLEGQLDCPNSQNDISSSSPLHSHDSQPPSCSSPESACIRPSTQRTNSHDLLDSQGSLWQRAIAIFGLPCIIGVAAIDPGNLEVDIQAGASTGYALIWALLLSSVLGTILQTLSAHVTICTGYHLAELCRRVYSRQWFLTKIVFAITILSIIAFDVAEVVGTAFAIQMLFHCPLWLGMLLSAADTMLVLYLQKTGMTRVQLIVEGLLFILSVCLIYEFFLSSPSATDIAQGTFVPTFGKRPQEGVILAVSIMGSVIMSHNLFLHSWLEKQRRNANSDIVPTTPITANDSSINNSATQLVQSCRYAAIESASIFFSTFLINACVLIVAASLPQAVVSTFDNLGLKTAGALLNRALGQQFAYTAWAIALLASGHAATVTGALASQAVCEGFLDIRQGTTPSNIILASRAIAIVPAVAVALVAGEQGSDTLAVASQTMLSFALPFAAIPLFKMLSVIKGPWASHFEWLLQLGYVVFCLVMVANVFAVQQVGRDIAVNFGTIALLGFLILVATTFLLVLVLIFAPTNLSDICGDNGRSIPAGESDRLLNDKKSTYSV